MLTHINIAILIAYTLTVLGVIITVILDNRNPLKTSAWVLIIGFIPIVGLLAYIIFGQEQRKLYRINKRYYKRLVRSPELFSFELPHQEQEQERLKPWRRCISRLAQSCESPLLPTESIEVYTTGHEYYKALFSDIERATTHIHIECYIFENDEVFSDLTQALIAKRLEGVDVRIIYDYLGSYSVPRERWEALKDRGIQVYAFLPVKLPLLSSTVNYRNHRKICIIDGDIGYMGGMNFALRYKYGDKLGSWRDTHFRLTGAIVMKLQSEFLMDWYTVSRRVVHVERFFPNLSKGTEEQTNSLGQFVFGGPLQEYPYIEQTFASLIYTAKEQVYIQTPYFLPTESLYNAIITAALSGVEVKLMIPRRGDSILTMLAMNSYLESLLKAGVRIYHYYEGFIHSKLLMVDGEVSVIGSANMDFRSLEHNFEVIGILYDKSLTKALEEIFNRDLNNCQVLTLTEWSKRSRLKRLLESVMRLFSPLL